MNPISKCIADGQGRREWPYLVGKWLGLITFTDEPFIRGSKLWSIIIDIKDPNGHWNFGFLMPVVWKERMQTINKYQVGEHRFTLSVGKK